MAGRTGVGIQVTSVNLALCTRFHLRHARMSWDMGDGQMTRRADGIFVVAALPENGSAFRSGEVEVGDIIVAIDGEPLEERSMQYAASLICGPVGTEVNLTLLRGADLIRDCGNHALYDVHHDWDDDEDDDDDSAGLYQQDGSGNHAMLELCNRCCDEDVKASDPSQAGELCEDDTCNSEVVEMQYTATESLSSDQARRRSTENSRAVARELPTGRDEVDGVQTCESEAWTVSKGRDQTRCANLVAEAHSGNAGFTEDEERGSVQSMASHERRDDPQEQEEHAGLVEVILERLPLSYVTGERTNAPLFGVGLGLDPCEHGGLVQVLAPGGAAERSGKFQVGDVVVTVDGHRISGWTAAQLRAAFLGPFASTVSIGLIQASAQHRNRNLQISLNNEVGRLDGLVTHVPLVRGEGCFTRLYAFPDITRLYKKDCGVEAPKRRSGECGPADCDSGGPQAGDGDGRSRPVPVAITDNSEGTKDVDQDVNGVKGAGRRESGTGAMGGPGPGMSQAWAAQGRSEQVSSAQGRSEQVSSKATGLSVAEKIPGGGQVGADEDDAYMCVICYDEMAFAADGQSISLPCGHMFHLGCIKEWLQRDACCPTCKSEVPGVLNRDQMPLMDPPQSLSCPPSFFRIIL